MFNFEKIIASDTMKEKDKKYSKVHFEPWEGYACKRGFGISGFDKKGHIVYGTNDNPGVKVLVLGESHYCAKIEDVATISMCKRIFADQTTENGEIPFYKIGTFGKEADAYISRALYNEYRNRFSFSQKGDVLISAAGTLGRTVVYDG